MYGLHNDILHYRVSHCQFKYGMSVVASSNDHGQMAVWTHCARKENWNTYSDNFKSTKKIGYYRILLSGWALSKQSNHFTVRTKFYSTVALYLIDVSYHRPNHCYKATSVQPLC